MLSLNTNLHLHEMIMSDIRLNNAMIGENTDLYLHRRVVMIDKMVINMIGSNTAIIYISCLQWCKTH